MKLYRDLAKEIKKANGDGGRQAKFEFLSKVRAVQRDLSTPRVIEEFNQIFRKYSHAEIAVVVAVTVMERKNYLHKDIVEWASQVLELWTNRPSTLIGLAIDDGLHPSRIEQYAGQFVSNMTE